jgi:hypothetical protein
MATTVVRYEPGTKHDNYRYIGRTKRGEAPNKWGNPFMLRKDASHFERLTCLLNYAAWLEHQELFFDVNELRGKVLVCWCAPELCHGHLLAKLADASDPRTALKVFMRRLVESIMTELYMEAEPQQVKTIVDLEPVIV